jgi:hypothetical protein
MESLDYNDFGFVFFEFVVSNKTENDFFCLFIGHLAKGRDLEFLFADLYDCWVNDFVTFHWVFSFYEGLIKSPVMADTITGGDLG